MEGEYLTLEKISSYQKSFDLSNEIWNIVIKWDYFAKDTVGKQFVRSSDSVSANIAEGFGRYSKKDKIRFYRISLGSLEESCNWLLKSSARKLILEIDKIALLEKFLNIKKEIYHLIKFTNEKLKY
jgi:four helix bundle protein